MENQLSLSNSDVDNYDDLQEGSVDVGIDTQSCAIAALNSQYSNDSMSKDDQCFEVHRFLGFAVKEAVKAHKSAKDKYIAKKEEARFEMELNMLLKMRILDHEAKSEENQNFYDDFYPSQLKMCNYGGLSLVSPLFMEFGLKLMVTIRMLVNESTIKEKGRLVLKDGYNSLLQNKDLRELYTQNFIKVGGNDVLNYTSFLSNIYHKFIIAKTFHARAKVVTKHFKLFNTGRFGSKSSAEALRTELRINSQAECSRTAKKVKVMTASHNKNN